MSCLVVHLLYLSHLRLAKDQIILWHLDMLNLGLVRGSLYCD